MPLLSRGSAWSAAAIVAGILVTGVSAYFSHGTELGLLALFAAAFIVAELVQRSDDELLPESLEVERFALAAPVQVAAIIVLGGWPAALVGAIGTWTVRPFKGEPWQQTLVRGTGLAVAAVAAGYAFELGGATTGHLSPAQDLLAVAVLGMIYAVARSLTIALAGSRIWPRPDLLTTAAEVGLGLFLAFAALENLWLAAALVPVLLLIDQVYGRLVQVRREMATALETFANIVDERDPTTHGHSMRVARYVSELASGLGLPRSEVSRLWWAGRLHDLGKVAVDAVVLRKPGKLDDAEWAAVRRAPRLSARLLQRFRFAAQQAQAVEYHRERYDGSGYYGADLDELPLAAHFLIVADSFDAMTTDRPFRRRRLSHAEALEEIERGAGTQFHPVIAKAFVAVRRRQDPAEVLAAAELTALREAAVPPRANLAPVGDLRQRPELPALLGVTTFLVGLGTGVMVVAAIGAALALYGLHRSTVLRRSRSRLETALREAMELGGDHARLFGRIADAVERAWEIDYAALVEWREDGAGGSVLLQRGTSGPTEPTLVSWLVREAESGRDLALDVGGELGGDRVTLALPLRRENSALVAFLVFRGVANPPAHLEPALRASLGWLGLTFAEAPPAVVLRKPLDPDGRQQARSLQA